ncbi:MAG: 4,5-DOPA dioxygenase extradiol [Culicoidibacterales bacterium]
MQMPVIFVGHGSPMNAIEHNALTQQWERLGEAIPRPKAIVVVSAHWYTKQTYVNDQEHPRQVYDMYGFPERLYELRYPVSGSQALATQLQQLLATAQVTVDNEWGIDHGTWSVLTHMYPKADIPVVQVSINRNMSLEASYQLGKQLRVLREQGILVLGSGNIVHHLGRVDWEQPESGYPEAIVFDEAIQAATKERNKAEIFRLALSAHEQRQVFATWEHFLPFIYMLGATTSTDNVRVFNNEYQYGSISMTSYIWTNIE